MEFTYHYERQEPQQLKYFLKEQGISKGLLAKIKFQGGKIFVNDQRQNVLYSLVQNDTVTIVIPDEGEHETVLLDETPIEIVYEDQQSFDCKQTSRHCLDPGSISILMGRWLIVSKLIINSKVIKIRSFMWSLA